MNRKQEIKVGGLVWIEQCKRFELPEGLENGMRLTVTAYESGVSATVTDGECEWTVDPIHLDTGWIFDIGGWAYEESTPEARRHLTAELKRLRGEATTPKQMEFFADRECEMLAVLERNKKIRSLVSKVRKSRTPVLLAA